METGCPADHDTHRDHDLELPNGVGLVDQARDGQRFVRHIDGDWEPWRQNGWIAQPFGVAAATGGLAEGRLVRAQAAEAREPGELLTHDDEFDLLFVRSGELRFVDESGERELGSGDSIVVPAGHAHRLVAESVELLEVVLPGRGGGARRALRNAQASTR